MNAGIMLLDDKKTPCIFYDTPLPHPVKHVEFNRADFCVTLVYDVPPTQGTSRFGKQETQGYTFNFPLDHIYVGMLEENKTVGVSHAKDGQIIDFNIYPVIFRP